MGREVNKPTTTDQPKKKPDIIKIIQMTPVAAMSAVGGGSNLMVLGLGDNSEVYIWNAKDRVWMER